MSSLVERLRGVVSGAVPRVETDIAAPAPAASTPHTTYEQRREVLTRAADALGGMLIERSGGAVIQVDRHYTPDRRHGRERIGDITDVLSDGDAAMDVLARAWPGRQTVDAGATLPRKLVFLDLETTGLAGGAGTQAFLVGCATIEDDGISVRQFLLPGFEHERAVLAHVGEWLRGTPGTLVTFNGKSFDVPLIETRFLFHRVPFPLQDVAHLDLLHPSRRLWKERPTVAGPALDDDSCKLSVLERHLAGYHRVGDVPGFEIPSRYFRFVRDGNAHPLEAVLEHNRIDLVSLALVTARVIRLIEHGPGSTTHPREALGLGRIYERVGATDDAEACYSHAASLAARIGREPDARAEALRRLALVRRRDGRMADAADAWQQLVTLPGCPAVLRREAREALAIHHEHRSRNLETARTLVLDALAEGAGARWREQAEYRLRRIERKLAVREKGGLLAALDDVPAGARTRAAH